MYFEDLQSRLIAAVKVRLQNGELTERRLAHLTGISQPHVHNVLKGARILSPGVADRILRRLRISLVDLFHKQELHERLCPNCSEHGHYREVPVLEGWLGPGLPLPRMANRAECYPFPRSYLAALEDPVVARLAADRRMTGVLREHDLVLLDHSAHRWTRLKSEALYVVNREGEGIVRMVRLIDQKLFLVAEDSIQHPRRWEEIPLAGRHVMDIVSATVVWIGRHLLRT